jgi:hypothetical protein
VAYEVEVDLEAREQIAALPAGALLALAEALAMLELTPWNGPPLNKNHPDGEVRTLPFGGAGLITYLILDDQERVDVLKVLWMG